MIIDRRGIVVDDEPSSAGSFIPSANLAIKTPCRVATTANITLSGLQTIDGVTLVADDRVLVKNQSSAVDNGIYTASSGNWERTTDFDSPYETVKGTQVLINEGTIEAGHVYVVTSSNPLIPGTSSLTFSISTAYQASANELTLNGVHGANIASASTINLETATGDLIDLTGTTTVNAITLSEGHERTVRTTGILTLTNGASLVLPGGANITTAAGDFFVFRGYAAGAVRCVAYQPLLGLLKGLSSTTDNLAARFDGATGKLIQDSPLVIADTTASLSRSGNGGVPLQGTNTNDAAAAGYVGELMTAEVTFAARAALTTGVVTTIVTISATAGDWDGNALFGFETSGGGVATEYHLEISTTAPPSVITSPNSAGTGGFHVSFVANQGQGFPMGPRQFLLAGTTTCYMKTLSTFTNSQTAYGFFRMRRMR